MFPISVPISSCSQLLVKQQTEIPFIRLQSRYNHINNSYLRKRRINLNVRLVMFDSVSAYNFHCNCETEIFSKKISPMHTWVINSDHETIFHVYLFLFYKKLLYQSFLFNKTCISNTPDTLNGIYINNKIQNPNKGNIKKWIYTENNFFLESVNNFLLHKCNSCVYYSNFKHYLFEYLSIHLPIINIYSSILMSITPNWNATHNSDKIHEPDWCCFNYSIDLKFNKEKCLLWQKLAIKVFIFLQNIAEKMVPVLKDSLKRF